MTLPATSAVQNAASVESKKQIPQMLGKASHTTLGFPTFSTAPAAIYYDCDNSRIACPKFASETVQSEGRSPHNSQRTVDIGLKGVVRRFTHFVYFLVG